jgi:hypothetical protein
MAVMHTRLSGTLLPPRRAAVLLTVVLCVGGCGSTPGVALRSSSTHSSAVQTGGGPFPDDEHPQLATPTPAPTPQPIAAAIVSRRPATPPPAPPAASGGTPGACPVFPASNPWNQDISAAPLDANSATWVARVNSFRSFVHPDFGSDPTYGIPYTVVGASQPFVPITFTAYGSESDPGPYPVPLNAPVESGGDRHVITVDTANCHLYEMYAAQRTGNGWSCDSGAVFDLRSNNLRPDTWTSADAAGLPIFAGLVRYDEVQSGVIDHALRFTVNETQNGFIHPATHQAGVANGSDPPMGARFRLKASFDLSHFSGASLVILRALKKYGMIVADNGSSWYISGSTDTRWNDNDLNQMKSVPGSAFEVVQTGTIQHG